MTTTQSRIEVILVAGLAVGSGSLAKFNVPNAGMEPTIKAGRQVEADLTAYVDVGEVQRGDVIVFRYPESPEHVFVKRVIGLPGETVSGKDGRIFINGVALSAGCRRKGDRARGRGHIWNSPGEPLPGSALQAQRAGRISIRGRRQPLQQSRQPALGLSPISHGAGKGGGTQVAEQPGASLTKRPGT